jgi:hypothetical protein
VLFAKEEPDSFGRLVVIDHGNGWQSAYGFLNKITVKEGDPVKAHERSVWSATRVRPRATSCILRSDRITIPSIRRACCLRLRL